MEGVVHWRRGDHFVGASAKAVRCCTSAMKGHWLCHGKEEQANLLKKAKVSKSGGSIEG